jgi:hypothetical protein
VETIDINVGHLHGFDPKTQTNLLGQMTSRKSTCTALPVDLKPKRKPKRVGDCKDVTQKSKFQVETNPFGSAKPKRKASILTRRQRFASVLYTLMFLQLRLRLEGFEAAAAAVRRTDLSRRPRRSWEE